MGWRLVLAGPASTLYFLAVVLPLLVAVYVSTLNWPSVAGASNAEFVGFDNYARAINDSTFQYSLTLTVGLALVGTVVLNVTSLVVANAVSSSSSSARIARTWLIYPLAVSPLVVGFVWRAFVSSEGVINGVARSTFDTHIPFLSSPRPAVFTLLAVTCWYVFGFLTVNYVAAIQAISRDLYEAAAIDGASSTAAFFRITVPLTAPAITVSVALSLVVFLRIYEFVVAMTGGGPAEATLTTSFLLVRNAFERSQFSYGMAQGIIFIGIVFVVTVLAVLGLRRFEHDT